MRSRHFIQLPLGEWLLSDSIYKYKMSKSLCEDGSPIYSIRLTSDSYHTGERLTMFEHEDYCFEEKSDRYKFGDHKIKYLSGLSGCGGLTIHSEKIYGVFHDCELLPRGSFKEYVKNEI